MLLITLALTACGSTGQQGDTSTYDDCPEVGAFEFSMGWAPGPGSAFPMTSYGTVVDILEGPPGTLVVSIDIHSGDQEPGIHVYSVPLAPGAGIDLFEMDEVSVSTQDLWGCLGCWIYETTIEREGEVILHALDCWNETCEADTFEVGPLHFSMVSGRCEPRKNPSDQDWWCNIQERSGLAVRCAGGTSDEVVELFQGQQTMLDCGATYSISAGIQMHILEGPSEGVTCSDHNLYTRQILVIRDGAGLSRE